MGYAWRADARPGVCRRDTGSGSRRPAVVGFPADPVFFLGHPLTFFLPETPAISSVKILDINP